MEPVLVVLGLGVAATTSSFGIRRVIRGRLQRAEDSWLESRGLVRHRRNEWQGKIDERWVVLHTPRNDTRLSLRFWPELDLELLVCKTTHVGIAPDMPRHQVGELSLYARSRERLRALLPRTIHHQLDALAQACWAIRIADSGLQLQMRPNRTHAQLKQVLNGALELMASLEHTRASVPCSNGLTALMPSWRETANEHALHLMQTPVALSSRFNGLNTMANAYRRPLPAGPVGHGLDVTSWFDEAIGPHFLLKPVQQGLTTFESAFVQEDGPPLDEVVQLSNALKQSMLQMLNIYGAVTLNENSLWLRMTQIPPAAQIPELMKMVSGLARDLEDCARERPKVVGYRTSARAAAR